MEELKKQEAEILEKRKYHKNRVNELTKDLYNTRQKIKYVKTHGKATDSGEAFRLFGKQYRELSPEELKEYNRIMQQKRRKKL